MTTPMSTMPPWWSERRFGLLINASVATVPAWAPIGQHADWYRSHLGDDVADVVVHPHPMVEVLAHHRVRWGHVESYDEFVALLTFDDFDAEAWVQLAVEAGAGYAVLVTKHHDGWAWWDSPGSRNRLTEHGPRRNVLAEFAAACERRDVLLGTSYSLLDWGDDRYPHESYVSDVVHPDVVDLVERFATVMLWGDGHWGHDAGVWKTAELMEKVRATDPDIVINDRWRASASDVPPGSPGIVRTFDDACPDDIVDGPWQLNRGMAYSSGYSRAERVEHHMTAVEIVDLYTEVLAKGGNLLLDVGPDSNGTIPELQAEPLRVAGKWIRRHADLLSPCRPWIVWGDPNVRYLERGSEIIAIDLSGRGSFDALGSTGHIVTSVTSVDGDDGDVTSGDGDVDWTQSDAGLVVSPDVDRGDEFGVVVCRVTVSDALVPDALFRFDVDDTIALAPLLSQAQPGDLFQLGDGVYEGPADVPAGAIVRGLGPGRTTIRATRPESATGMADGATLTVGRNARVEHLHVVESSGPPHTAAPVSIALDQDFATVLGCTVDGLLSVTGDDVLVRAVSGRGVRSHAADRLHISRCHFRGNRWDVGIELHGGGGQHVESNRLDAHLCAVRLTESTGTTVRGNEITARWWGVRLERTDGAHVHGNRVGWTMRAIDVDAGRKAVVDGNAVHDGDSGCIVQAGAADCEVYGNHWDRCRIGLLTWDTVGLHHQDNVAVGLHEPDSALVTGP